MVNQINWSTFTDMVIEQIDRQTDRQRGLWYLPRHRHQPLATGALQGTQAYLQPLEYSVVHMPAPSIPAFPTLTNVLFLTSYKDLLQGPEPPSTLISLAGL